MLDQTIAQYFKWDNIRFWVTYGITCVVKYFKHLLITSRCVPFFEITLYTWWSQDNWMSVHTLKRFSSSVSFLKAMMLIEIFKQGWALACYWVEAAMPSHKLVPRSTRQRLLWPYFFKPQMYMEEDSGKGKLFFKQLLL